MRRSRRPRRSSPTQLRGRECRCQRLSLPQLFVFADQLSAARYGNGAPASDLIHPLPPEEQVPTRQPRVPGSPDASQGATRCTRPYPAINTRVLASPKKTAPLATALIKDLLMSRRCCLTYPELARLLVACRIPRFRSETSIGFFAQPALQAAFFMSCQGGTGKFAHVLYLSGLRV